MVGVQLWQGLEPLWVQPLKSVVKLLHLVRLLISAIYENRTRSVIASCPQFIPANPMVMHRGDIQRLHG